jgi:hypothetical protein
MLIRYSLVPPLGHLCGSERPQHPTNPSMESELSRLSNRPGQCAVVFLPHSTTDFLGASSAPQWATYLKLHGFRSRAACQVVRSFPAKNLWSQNVLESQAVRPTCKRNLFETTFASSSPLTPPTESGGLASLCGPQLLSLLAARPHERVPNRASGYNFRKGQGHLPVT